MKTTYIYFSLILSILALTACRGPKRIVIPSLAETFQRSDKNPFGGYVAFKRIKEQLDDRYIETNDEPFDVAWKNMDNSDTTKHTLYLLLTKNLMVSNEEADALYDYVTEGNDLFIAADYISINLLNKIECSTERDSEVITEVAGNMKQTYVRLMDDIKTGHSFHYYYYPFYNSFSQYDSSRTKVLGLNELGKPNFIVQFLGAGRLYLNSAPRAFSNYFLLKDDNHQYLEHVISYLRPGPKNIFWMGSGFC